MAARPIQVNLPANLKLATDLPRSEGKEHIVLGRSMGNASTILACDPAEGYTPLPDLPLRKASAFDAPSGYTPVHLFTHLASEHTPTRCHETAYRFVRRTNDREMLIYVDGSCLDQNSSEDVGVRRAGCAWVYKPAACSQAIRLEATGPTGEEHPQTSNRAELRAALDSEYVALGITQRIETWAARGWRPGAGSAVKNKDLWKALLDRINEMAQHGTEVAFWKIPREQNTMADLAAKDAALNMPAMAEFGKIQGMLV